MAKYLLQINRLTNERSIKILKTGKVIREFEHPDKYLKLRQRALNNKLRRKSYHRCKNKNNNGGNNDVAL